MIGIDRPFLYEVADTVIKENLTSYPNLTENSEYITRVIRAEEETFAKTIDIGSALLDGILDDMKADGTTELDGETVFRLNDTCGFPLDLTKEIAEERGFTVDEPGFRAALDEQKKRSREDTLKNKVSWETDLFKGLDIKPTVFVGYDTLANTSKVEFIAVDGKAVNSASEGDEVKLVLGKTPFYAESGGQVGDCGTITAGMAKVEISDCQKTPEGYFTHIGTVVSGVIEKGDEVTAVVCEDTRRATMRNHTSVHLLQAALREALGDHVHQAGSFVDSKRSRFDFAHYEAVTPDELKRVEDIVNRKVLQAAQVDHKVMRIEEAKDLGALALFGEKYGDVVRVIDVKGYSTEFCGGTHVHNTSELGLYKIIAESSVASGIRRIEATTGYGVLELIDSHNELIDSAAEAFKLGNRTELANKARAAALEIKELERENESLRAKIAGASVSAIMESCVEVEDLKVFSGVIDGAADDLRSVADEIKGRCETAVILLGCKDGGRVTLCAACGSSAVKSGIKAGDLVKKAAAVVGGSGGGKPDMAMAGGKNPEKLNDALAMTADFVKELTRGG